jgi:hypothetical protein
MLASTVPLLVTVLAAGSPVQALSSRYLDGLFHARPHLATYMGVHTQDGRMMDLDPPAITQRIRELNALAAQVKALDVGKLSTDDKADARILADGIALELLYLTDIREWAWDSRLEDSFPFYDPREYVASRLGELIHGTFAPESQRAKWAAAQLKALPHHLSMKQSSLVTPEPVRLAQAVKDNAGRITFFNTELKTFTAKYPDAEKARVEAVKALEAYQQFLSSFPAAKATHDWRLGKELYDRKFPLALQTDMTPAQLQKAAEEAFEAERGKLYTSPRLSTEPAGGGAGGERPVNAGTGHPSGCSRLARTTPQRSAGGGTGARDPAHVHRQKNLLMLPPPDTPRPARARVQARRVRRGILSPGMLDKTAKWHGTLRGPGRPELASGEGGELPAGERLVRDHPDRGPRGVSGSPHADMVRAPAPERAPEHAVERGVRGGLGRVRGGAHDPEGVRREGERPVRAPGGVGRDDRGGERDPRHQAPARGDDGRGGPPLHGGRGIQEKALAEKKLLRAKLDSTQLCQYFLGLSGIEALERDVKARGKFDQRVFNQELVGHGTVPVKILRAFFRLDR